MKTETLGNQPIFGTGRDAYYEDVWSNTYTMNVSFYSGYEFNDSRFEINDIIAIVKWNSGGYSTIKIEGWSTDTKYITEAEVKDDTMGHQLELVTGYDTEKIFWEIRFE